MRLGLNVGYWGLRGDSSQDLALVQEAERLGFSTVWVAEAYGSDAVSVLAWIAAQTSSIDVGSAILQIPARTPAMTAMTAATLDTLSQGRFRLGLGVSGPQVSEGWHGVRFAKPLARTREYVDVVNLALSRQRVEYHGSTYELPLPDGPGKALHLMLHPVREHIPLYLAAIGPKNLELCGEIADGWLPVFFATGHVDDSVERITAGRAKAGKDLTGFDIAPTVPLVVGPDVAACADPVRPYAALYVGGMGSREQNFYNALATRMGFGEAAEEVQQRYLAKDYDGAAAAVPHEFIDATSLLGPVERIAERMAEFAAAGVGTLSVSPFGDTPEQRIDGLRAAAEALEKSGVAFVQVVPMTLLQAIVLGIVQGLTEFLPISSTAHLRIVPALFGWHFSYNHGKNDPGAPFTAIIQLGTTIAIVGYFWRELLQVTVAWFKGLRDKQVRSSLEYKLGWYLILATVPVSVFGLVFSDQITTGARNLWIIAVTLIALAFVLLAAEKVGRRNREEEQITVVDAAVVGTAQALALIPGASRSGTTITAGLFRGLTREAAARFSFLLSIPAVVLSGGYEAINPGKGGTPGVGLTGVAVVLAFVVGLASIHWLMRWLSNHSTYIFIYYRIALGVLLIVLLSTGVLHATR